MPHPDILKALKMTAQEWGQLPVGDDTREKLRAKAIRIMQGIEAVPTASEAAIEREKLIHRDETSRLVTQAGFEQAMVQNAKSFGEAIEMLRTEFRENKAAIQEINTRLNSFDERLQAIEKRIAEDDAELNKTA